MPFWVQAIIFIIEFLLCLYAAWIIFFGKRWSVGALKRRAHSGKRGKRKEVNTSVFFVGNPGCGKTQAQIKFLVSEVESGTSVVWISPHYTLYHPEDQPTDLRPMKHKFRQVGNYQDIAAELATIRELVDKRLEKYREGEGVGKKMVLVIDELPAISDVCGKKTMADLVSILREGRKTKVFVVAAAQDALTETLGIKSGARNLFQQVYLAWNIDQHSWNAFSKLKRPSGKLPLGKWYRPDGSIEVV
jgi:hypothetical protein